MSRIYLLTICLCVILLSIFLSCDNSTGPGNSHIFPDPVDSVATDIMLTVYSNGWGTLLDTIIMATEGTIVIDIEEQNPYFDPPQYYIYAVTDGFYTEIYKCQKGDTISVDLDAVPQVSNSLTGVIFAVQPFFADCYFADQPIAVSVPGGTSITTKTDAQGRYGVADLSVGDYIIHFAYQGVPYSFVVSNTSGTDYREISFIEPNVAYAPDIYLYPEITSQIQVVVDFPEGGKIIESEPPYNSGWDVSVTPEGIIDGQYDYLFYEAEMTNKLNHQYGWLLNGENLENEFRTLLARLGFVGREIDDFVEYWIPKIGETKWLAVYPQDVESMIRLDISPQPDNILRALFLFRPLEIEISIPRPPYSQPEIIRDKFTVVEWGAII